LLVFCLVRSLMALLLIYLFIYFAFVNYGCDLLNLNSFNILFVLTNAVV
jgi:hypothetical protein